MIPSAALFERPQMPPARHLLQFKAGKMTQDSDNWVHADPRKGWVYVYQSGDGRLHFTWIDRKTCLVEDDFVIAPKQGEFKKVMQCTTGRVYLLKLKGPKRFFIWMQACFLKEPNTKKDDDICTKINDYIEFVPAQTNTQIHPQVPLFVIFTYIVQCPLTPVGSIPRSSQCDCSFILTRVLARLSFPLTL
ncbi:unnamed protein product [Echinostoma caproni]|uniref:Pru domain-containing protein n=1 Tax=Echinostoma caproni TaxID=27848 RepID=A0A183BGK9_9TREM|nr:unnamed protein product [Echinostoma caproni]